MKTGTVSDFQSEMSMLRVCSAALRGWADVQRLAAGPKSIHGRGLAGTPAGQSEPWVAATPRVCLHDVPTTLRAGGLPPQAPVTFSASLADENGKQFCSCAHYVSDEAGKVDLRAAAAVGGSYTGVFPAGLLTTLKPAPHELPSLRLYRRNPSLPWRISVSVLAGHQPLGVQEEQLAEVELERHLMAPGVRRQTVRVGRVRGALYLPPGDGPFPGVVDMFGSIGGLMEFRSALLASRGFASLAVAVFAYDDLPPNTDHIDLDYFEEAVNFLLAVPGVIPDRCGTVAISKSGDIVLSMATLIPAVKAAVGISSCTLAFGSRFTYKGKLFRRGIPSPVGRLQMNDQGAYCTNFGEIFNNDEPEMIPVEEADDDTHFLIAVGEDDPWGFKHSLAPFRERMLRHNKRNFETVLYPGTGHIIEPPYGPLISQSFQRHIPKQQDRQELSKGAPMAWGGKPGPTCAAQEDLWQRMRNFLMLHVREESPWYQQHLAQQSGHAHPKAKL